MSDLENLIEELRALKSELEQTKAERNSGKETALASAASNSPAPKLDLSVKQKLVGHFGKVYACAWAPDSNRVLSACQDGRLIIWNARNGFKNHVVALNSAWVMSCGYGSSGTSVASGGLDNICSVFPLGEEVKIVDSEILVKHDGYISSINFFDDSTLLTTSGDSTAILWDVTTNKPTTVFSGHEQDVMAAAISEDCQTFLTGSVDCTVKLWDVRENQCVKTFTGHEQDVNDVKLIPGDNAFVTAGDEGVIRVFDIRAYAEVNRIEQKEDYGVSSVDVSSTGKYVVAAFDDPNNSTMIFDTVLGGECSSPLRGHERRVAMARIAPGGFAVLTASWDSTLQIYAA